MEGSILLRRTKFEPDVMINAVLEYLNGQTSQQSIADRLGIVRASFQAWIRKYQSMGADAFTQDGNRHYSKELKEQAVTDYLAGRGSIQNICKNYKIMSVSQLKRWIMKYNEDKDVPHPLKVGDEKRITGGELISPSSLKRNVECFSCGKT